MGSEQMSRKTINDWRDLRPIWEQPWPGDVNLHLVEEIEEDGDWQGDSDE